MALALYYPRRAEYKLRSESSLVEAYVLFVNKTERDIDLYWIDYSGQKSLYLTLKPGQGSKIDTYQTHPWIFCDKHTGERMQVQHSDIYWPKRYAIPNPRNPSEFITCRRKIIIHLPLRPLRDTCLWRIAKQIYRTTSVIEAFSIPQTLKTDLKNIICLIEKHRLTP